MNTPRSKWKAQALGLLSTFVLTAALEADVVFQAGFNGVGSGNGRASDIVTLGGTGVLEHYSTATIGIQSSATMGQGNYVSLRVPVEPPPSNGGLGRVVFTPSSAANSMAAMNTVEGGSVRFDGGFDFFYRFDQFGAEDTSEKNWFRPFDFGSGTEGNLRLILLTDGPDLRFELLSNRGFLTGAGFSHQASVVSGNSDPIAWREGVTYHIGLTLHTDPVTDVSSLNVYLKADGGTIDTSSSDDLIISKKFKVDGNVVTDGLHPGIINFSLCGTSLNGSGSGRVQSMDLFRIYDSVPKFFVSTPEPPADPGQTVSIPESSAYTLIVGSLAMALCCGRRRR